MFLKDHGMKWLETIRYSEWWVNKLCPLLALGYATILMNGGPFLRGALFLAFLLFSIANGAAYVCFINDITDIREDLVCGKRNRMIGVPRRLRWILPVACLLVGAPFLYILWPDWLSMVLYPLPCIAFSLYSFEPFRLKRRGFWGVLADASGSHLFPSLYIVSAMSFYTAGRLNWVWFGAVAVWSLCYGLRGILWHQFRDRDNDLKAGVNTFASRKEGIRREGRLIFLVEILALSVMLYQTGQPLCVLFLGLYLFLVVMRAKILGRQVILVQADEHRKFQILMMDYYQTFLPLALLAVACGMESAAIVVLVIHVSLFPFNIRDAGRDAFFSLRHVIFQRG